MKESLIITQVELKDHKLNINESKYLSIDIDLSLMAYGNFSKYVKNNKLNKELILQDIIRGNIDIKGLNN